MTTTTRSLKRVAAFVTVTTSLLALVLIAEAVGAETDTLALLAVVSTMLLFVWALLPMIKSALSWVARREVTVP